MSTVELLKVVGGIAGLGGLVIGAFLILFREVIRKKIFSNLTKEQSYKIIRLILILVTIITILGLGAWFFSDDKTNNDDKPINSIISEPDNLELVS